MTEATIRTHSRCRPIIRLAWLACTVSIPANLSAQGARAARPTNVEASFLDASIAWDEGRYIEALRGFTSLLSGPDSSRVRERIALLTGENWSTTLVAENARNPRWSGDGRFIAMDLGQGQNRLTRIVRAGDGGTVADIKGMLLVFSPDGGKAAYVDGLAADGDVVERLLTDGSIRKITGPRLRTAQLAYSTDGKTLYAIGALADGTRTQLFASSAGPLTLVPIAQGDSSLAELQVAPDGRMVMQWGRSALGGGAAFARSPRRQIEIVGEPGSSFRIEGESPVSSRNGDALVFIRRSGNVKSIVRMSHAARSIDTLINTTDSIMNLAVSPDGKRVVFQRMLDKDWELYVAAGRGTPAVRLTREIQHDLLPQFLDNERVLATMGEGRHRRSYIYHLDSLTQRRLFHNNTVRTIAPEYEWAPSPDATRVLVVAERDGDTVTPHRHLWMVDLRRQVTNAELRARLAANLAAEQALRSEGTRRYAPIAAAVRDAVAQVSTDRIYRYEKALFDFDSKHVSQPGNLLARNYLLNQYQSFGLDARFQPFEARTGVDRPAAATANVLAVLKGTENPELVYVVSSHFDSRAEGPGADDNTSGTAALLEAARVLSTRPQPATIIFASFTGEESGLLGSREFVRQAKIDNVKLVGALNNDMLGWSNDNRLDNTIRYSNAGIRDLQHAAAFLFTRMITYDAFYYKSTDAAAFYDGYGDIVGGIGSYPVLGNPHYHMPHDVLEFENHQLIAEASKTTVASLMMLASSPSRIAGLAVKGTTATWTRSPEKSVVRYLVRYGPASAPEQYKLEVTSPRAVLPNLRDGMTVRVKAVNSKGLEGWDWAVAAASGAGQ